ncbi:hypothetical protein NG798_03395 [Ancylothrix sp. C2]|nr:hypothetical protein [Ancylothrix sp. D3o]
MLSAEGNIWGVLGENKTHWLFYRIPQLQWWENLYITAQAVGICRPHRTSKGEICFCGFFALFLMLIVEKFNVFVLLTSF